MLSKSRKILFMLILSGLSLSTQARPMFEADGQNDPEAAVREHHDRRIDRAAGEVQRQTGGRVLSASVDEDNGDKIRIKVLMPNGRVRTVTVDAGTGDSREYGEHNNDNR